MRDTVYLFVLDDKIISEKNIRDLYFDLEMDYLYQNIEEFKKGEIDLKTHLKEIEKAYYGGLGQIITSLEKNYNKKIKSFAEYCKK